VTKIIVIKEQYGKHNILTNAGELGMIGFIISAVSFQLGV